MKLKFTFATLAFLAVAHAQTVRGSIGGVVTDPASKPLTSASVTLINDETNAKWIATTNAQGEFTIAVVPPGAYRIEVERDGFRKHEQHLRLEVDQEIRVEIPLLPGSPATIERVEVTGEPALVRSQSSTLGGVIDNRMVLGLQRRSWPHGA